MNTCGRRQSLLDILSKQPSLRVSELVLPLAVSFRYLFKRVLATLNDLALNDQEVKEALTAAKTISRPLATLLWPIILLMGRRCLLTKDVDRIWLDEVYCRKLLRLE